MSVNLLPAFNGSYQAKSVPDDFIEKFAKRIDTGLFPLAPDSRNQYEVVEQSKHSMRFRSTNVWTGINVGLNDVQVQLDEGTSTVRYQVSYWTWAKYAIFLCLAICAILGFFVLSPLFGFYLFAKEQYPSPAAMKFGVVPMLVFWGLIWPWILIVFHKKPAAHCLTGLFKEVLDSSPQSVGV